MFYKYTRRAGNWGKCFFSKHNIAARTACIQLVYTLQRCIHRFVIVAYTVYTTFYTSYTPYTTLYNTVYVSSSIFQTLRNPKLTFRS